MSRLINVKRCVALGVTDAKLSGRVTVPSFPASTKTGHSQGSRSQKLARSSVPQPVKLAAALRGWKAIPTKGIGGPTSA